MSSTIFVILGSALAGGGGRVGAGLGVDVAASANPREAMDGLHRLLGNFSCQTYR